MRGSRPPLLLLLALVACLAFTEAAAAADPASSTPSITEESGEQISPPHPAWRPVRTAEPQPTHFSYDELVEVIDDGQVLSAEVYPERGLMELYLRDGRRAESGYAVGDSAILERLSRSGARVEILQSSPSGWLTFFTALPIVLILIFFFVFLWLRQRQMGGSVRGRTKEAGLRKSAKVGEGDAERPLVRFADVAGCDEAVEELQEMLHFLKSPDRYTRVGARMPSAVMLYGPPGTGKTLLAKALAGEAGVPFYAVSGSDFIEMFVGVGAKRMRELFQKARTHKEGAVVFIDEIDAIGKARSAGGPGGNDERDQTLNQLLVELDGFGTSNRVVVVAATNRLDTLDPALLRPGRFGRQIPVDLPSEEGRGAILAVHAKGKPIADEVDLARLAKMTGGLSGAQLAEVVNEAAIMAARQERLIITQADFDEGTLRVLMGPEKRSSMLAEGELEVIAYHEAGHVLTAELCPSHEKAQRATVRPRGRAAGLALYGREDRALHDAEYMHEQMVCALGGRAAEQLQFGKVSSGAANDLQVVNQIARRAVEEFGLSASVGQLVSSSGGQPARVSEETMAAVDREVERIVHNAYKDALRLLDSHRAQLEALAKLLLSQGDLERVDIVAAIEGVRPQSLTPDLGTRREESPLEPLPKPQIVAQPFRRRGLLERGAEWVLGRKRQGA